MSTLRLEIITPEAKVYSDDVDSVVLPAVEGEIGVFPMHIPLMTQIVPGELHAKKNGQDLFLAVGEGFVQITGNKVAVLTDMAVKETDIDIGKAEEALRRAEEALKQKDLGPDAEAALRSALLRSTAQLQVKRRRHH
ncbi:MAG: ATP synthase F1 subunit epsilon [Verrucomicrobiota bacterium]|nr:ATP synthase F1 subunit epsilon [Verrucomicrobiota bacterium]